MSSPEPESSCWLNAVVDCAIAGRIERHVANRPNEVKNQKELANLRVCFILHTVFLPDHQFQAGPYIIHSAYLHVNET